MLYGKRYFLRIYMQLPGNRLQNVPLPVGTGMPMRRVLITVLFVEIYCLSQTQSLPAIVAGRVFLNPSVKTASSIKPTTRTACSASKLPVRDAILTWDIYLMMA